jgi:hypothetical protein
MRRTQLFGMYETRLGGMLVAVSPLFLILPTMLVATTSYIDSAISARAVLEPLGATPVGALRRR